MTFHRNRFLVNKTKRCTEFQFYWYYYSTCFGRPFCPSSGVLSRISALIHFMKLWPFANAFHSTPGSKRSQLHKVYQSRYTAKNSWWWAERLPETCRVIIPIKFEFSAFVGLIHKEPCTCYESYVKNSRHILSEFSCFFYLLTRVSFSGCLSFLLSLFVSFFLVLFLHRLFLRLSLPVSDL